MRRYLLSPIAEQDIDEIVTYIAQDNSKCESKDIINECILIKFS